MAVKISRVADRSPGGPRSYLLDPERLAAALGAAVRGAVGVAAGHLEVTLLLVVVAVGVHPGHLGGREGRVEGRRTVVALGGRGAAGGLVRVLRRAGRVAGQDAVCGV